MLFLLHPQTPICKVFVLLNNELLNFLRKSITSTEFSEALFTLRRDTGSDKSSVCWTNTETQNKFYNLYQAMPNSIADRMNLYIAVKQAQKIETFFYNTKKHLPSIESEKINNIFKELTTHLFSRTSKIIEAEKQSNSSINNHYQDFLRINNNSTLCYVCGTECLSQNRNNLAGVDQWRADYDHILCKDKYPIYGVHPKNFLPTCHTCNSKAKGARNLLIDKKGERRKAFYPLPPANESSHFHAKFNIKLKPLEKLKSAPLDSPFEEIFINFPTASAELTDKINVWQEVYQVASRVEARVTVSFFESISSRLNKPLNFEEFCGDLKRSTSRGMPNDYLSSEWSFWWHRVCEHLVAQDTEFLQNIWALLEWKLKQTDNTDMEATFGKV